MVIGVRQGQWKNSMKGLTCGCIIQPIWVVSNLLLYKRKDLIMSSILKSKWFILIGFIIVYCGVCNKKNTEPIKRMPGWLVHIVFPFSSKCCFTARYVNVFACYTGFSWMIISIVGYIQIFLGVDSVEDINMWWILNGLGIETIEVIMDRLIFIFKELKTENQ